ncbi:MAG: Ig-like domain-containing protein [Deltaproteobacteria bacterium]|nr:Ig-like domain-containing protein [Deltaproteobacteria bacterium]
MRYIQYIIPSLVLTVVGLLISACGTQNPNTPLTLFNTALNFDFRVTSSSPVNLSTNISTNNNTIQVFFSETIDPATSNGNVIVKKEVFGSTQTITPVDIEVVGNMIDIEVTTTALESNAIYYVILLSGLTSTNNNQLYDGQYPQGVQISFNTGTGFGNSLPGPPKVQSINKFNNFNGCFTAMVRFDEDVSLFNNDITLSSTAFLSLGNGGLVNTSIYPYYTGRQDVWVVDAQGCSLLAVSAWLQEITVTVHDAVDLDGNHVDCSASYVLADPLPCEETF